MKSILPFIFPLLFIGLLVGINIYLARRFNFYFNLDSTGILYVVFGLLTVLMLFGGMATTNSVGSLGHITNIIAFTLLGFFLYLVLSAIAFDLVGFIIEIKPVLKGLLTIGTAALISLYGIINARTTQVTHVEIPISSLSEKIKAMHLTDTHIGHFRGAANLRKLVLRINQEEVDIVFFTGDLLDGRIELKESSIRPLADLKAPVYFVEGNHDKYTGVDAIKNYLRSIGVNVLTNEVEEWQGIQIMGLNHMLADSSAFDMHAGEGRMTVRSALETLTYDTERPLILLHHGPAGIKYAADAGVDLYLAGHTHGGQMFPATLIARAIFEYNKGLHKLGNTYVHVCYGTGTFGPPMRIGTKSEMTVLHLQPQD